MGCFKVVIKSNRKNNVGHYSGPYIATVSVTSTTTLQHVSSDTACKDTDYWPLLSLQRDLGCWSNLTVGAAAWRVAKAIMAKDFGKWGKMSGMRPAIFRIKPAAHVITAGECEHNQCKSHLLPHSATVELVYRTKNSSFFWSTARCEHLSCARGQHWVRWSEWIGQSFQGYSCGFINKAEGEGNLCVCVCRCKQGSKHYAYYRGLNN